MPLATRQKSKERDSTCRLGTVFAELRGAEKFEIMLLAAVRSASKDMVGLGRGVFLRGNDNRDTSRTCPKC